MSTTSLSTPNSELVAAAQGMAHRGEPLRLAWEYMLSRTVSHAIRTDSDVARLAALKGYSRRLAYLKKAQRLSIGWIHDMCMRADTGLARLDTKKKRSDLLTKGLDHTDHWRHVQKLGMRGFDAHQLRVEMSSARL